MENQFLTVLFILVGVIIVLTLLGAFKKSNGSSGFRRRGQQELIGGGSCQDRAANTGWPNDCCGECNNCGSRGETKDCQGDCKAMFENQGAAYTADNICSCINSSSCPEAVGKALDLQGCLSMCNRTALNDLGCGGSSAAQDNCENSCHCLFGAGSGGGDCSGYACQRVLGASDADTCCGNCDSGNCSNSGSCKDGCKCMYGVTCPSGADGDCVNEIIKDSSDRSECYNMCEYNSHPENQACGQGDPDDPNNQWAPGGTPCDNYMGCSITDVDGCHDACTQELLY